MTGIPVVLTIPAGTMAGGWIRRKDQRQSDKQIIRLRGRPAVPPAVTRPTDRISRDGRDQRLSPYVTALPESERPCRLRAWCCQRGQLRQMRRIVIRCAAGGTGPPPVPATQAAATHVACRSRLPRAGRTSCPACANCNDLITDSAHSPLGCSLNVTNLAH